jgi:pilus assembly protein Flp/PilA
VLQIIKSNLALLKDRRGVTAVEYAVIAGVVVVGIAGAFTALGTKLSAFFDGLKL